MKCGQCKREMVKLFTSCRCDWCDYAPPPEKLHRGYVVRGVPETQMTEFYVFRTRLDAVRWQTAAGLLTATIEEVRSIEPFRWHLSRSSHIADVVLADHMFEVFEHHRYEPLPHRAFIARKE